MALIRLVPHADHSDPVCPCTVAIDEERKRQRADVPAHTGTDRDAHDQREPQRVRHVIQIFQAEHKICLLITHGVSRDEVVIPEILFRLLQLYHSDACLRCGSQELLPRICRARRETCRVGPMPGLIHSRDDLERIFRLQCFIDPLFRKFTAIGKAIRRRAGLHRLIPDRQDPRGTVDPAEHPACIIDPTVHDPDQHPLPF